MAFASLQPSHHGSKFADSAASGLLAESSEKWHVVEVGLQVAGVEPVGLPTPLQRIGMASSLLQGSLVSSQPRRLCYTGLEGRAQGQLRHQLAN